MAKTLWRPALVILALGFSSCATLFHSEEERNECNYRLTKVGEKPTMHALACGLDHLERHIERYGSVVAKVPDVWGQARLTKYREEFEKEMATNIPLFKETLQGR